MLTGKLPNSPRRIVSLVPSVTESLFELGAGERVVGVTDYCIHPAERVARLPRVGGTKNPDVRRIVALAPDLVIANREENTKAAVEALEALGIRVWVTFPETVRQALDLLWEIVRQLNLPGGAPHVETLERALDWTRGASGASEPVRVFCPIWRDTSFPPAWWMTANRDTYLHDVLAVCGGENVFADRSRRYPLSADLGRSAARPDLDGDTRYPRVIPDEIISAAPDVILLPSEPFEFGEHDREMALTSFAATPAGRSGRVHLCDGSLLTWHGTRMGQALVVLPTMLRPDLPVSAARTG